MDNMSGNKPSTSITNVGCKSKLHTVVRPSSHSCAGNWVAIGLPVVYYARTAEHLMPKLNVGNVETPTLSWKQMLEARC